MHKKDGSCYLCILLHSNYSPKMVQEHHVIFGSANRKLSEKYGLKVYLCLEHHEESKEAVHKNAEIALILKKEAQKCFEKNYPNLSFMEIFGKNYLDDEDINVLTKEDNRQQLEDGFIPISDGLDGLEW